MAAKYDLISIFGENYMACFEDIDFETFIGLQPEHIKEAIPKLVPRIKFENLFKIFLKKLEENKKEAIGVADESNDVDVNDVSHSIIEPRNYNNCEEPLFDQTLPLFNNTPQHAINSESILNPPSHCKQNTVVIKTPQDIIDIPSIELKIVITKRINESQAPIPDHDRVVIGKAIIHHLLVNNFERVIKREEFMSLSELIVQLFPQEKKGTYYTPANKGTPAQGRLFSAYQAYKTPLREAGLINKRAKALSRAENEDYTTGTINLMQEKSDAFRFVLEESEDFEQVKDCWQFCFRERQTLLNQLSIFEYIRRFPSFNSPEGYELLRLDADSLHANKESKLLEIAPKIFAYASQSRKFPLEVRTLLAAYRELVVDLEENSLKILQQLTAIKLLPHVMPNPKRKLSKSEIANLFCPHFKTRYEADTYNLKFVENYKETSLILKPRMYFIGDQINPSAYLHIADKNYKIDNSVAGFEILLKSYLGLNCKYPDPTKHIWQFVQKEIYDIDIEGEDQPATVEAFIQDIRIIIN